MKLDDSIIKLLADTKSPLELKQLLQSLRAHWIESLSDNPNQLFEKKVRLRTCQIYDELLAVVPQGEKDESSLEESDALIHAKTRVSSKISAGSVFAPADAVGRFLDGVRADSSQEYAGALGAILRVPIEIHPRNSPPKIESHDLIGFVRGTCFVHEPMSDSDLCKSLKKLEAEHREILLQSNEARDQFGSKAAKRLIATKRLLAREQARWLAVRSQHERQLFQSLEAAKQRIKELEDIYLKKLELDASVSYWKRKCSKHRIAGWTMTLVFVTGAVALGVWLYQDILHAEGSFPSAAQLPPFATGDDGKAAPSTSTALVAWRIARTSLIVIVAFWVLHQFIRLGMSNFHLASDSSERATMVLTYIALLKEGSATEADRQALLSALFRPSTTGLFREGMGPPGLHQLVTFRRPRDS